MMSQERYTRKAYNILINMDGIVNETWLTRVRTFCVGKLRKAFNVFGKSVPISRNRQQIADYVKSAKPLPVTQISNYANSPRHVSISRNGQPIT